MTDNKAPQLQSICILRLSAIGDACHAVATVQAIQKRWPQAEITWVIGKVAWQLVQDLPDVEFIVFDKSSGFKGLINFRKRLKKRQFDVLLHMQVSLRANLVSFCINAKEKWGFDKTRAKEGHSLFINRQIKFQLQPHVADGFLAFAQAIDVPQGYQLEWKIPIAQNEIDWHKENLSTYYPYIVISPAASRAERNWLPERYAGFANYAFKKGFNIVFCGNNTTTEQNLVKEILSFCEFMAVNLVGKTTLKQLLIVIKQAQLLLTPDSGPAHIASTVDTPVIGLYVHSNPKRTGPYKYQEYVVSQYEEALIKMTGKSSQENKWGKVVKGNDLMKSIELESVIEKFEMLYQTGACSIKAGQNSDKILI